MDALYECLKSEKKYGYEAVYFWVSGVALVSTGFLGLIGNILNLIVLTRPKFRKRTFYNLLIQLTFFDILVLLSYGIHVGYQSMACTEIYNLNVSHITYQLLNICLTGSIYSTVVVSIERYIGMYHPKMKYGQVTWIYVVSVIFIAISYNFPRLFEYQYKVINGTLVAPNAPWAEKDTYKDRYHDLSEILVENAIPMMLLCILNGTIIRNMYGTCQNKTPDVGNKSRKNRATSTRTLLMIVAVFMISHIPCITFKMLYYLGCRDCTEEEQTIYRGQWFFIYPIKRLALMANSSVNVIIYCIVGTKYRDELISLLGCKNGKLKDAPDHSSTAAITKAFRYSIRLIQFKLTDEKFQSLE